MQNSQEIKFEGGKELKGKYKDFHNAMMKNELANGFGGYQLGWAKNDKSGPSFGGNQLDYSQ